MRISRREAAAETCRVACELPKLCSPTICFEQRARGIAAVLRGAPYRSRAENLSRKIRHRVTLATHEGFQRYVKKNEETGCWIWMGRLNDSGYGRVFIQGKIVRAHRRAWEMANGPIPNGMHVLHNCDVRACVNPDHLHLGTNADNTRERTTRIHSRVLEQVAAAQLSEASVIDIRSSKMPPAALARRFGIPAAAVHLLRKGNEAKATLYLDIKEAAATAIPPVREWRRG